MRKLLRIVSINLGLLAAGLLIVELIFGGWAFGTNYGVLVIPKDFSRRFDVSGRYQGGTISVYKRDKHGLRGTYGEPSDIDILVIGGSTTNEIFVTEGATWSDTIAKAFAEAGRDVRVANAGIDGQSTLGHIKNFEHWFPKIPGLKPRYVLALLGVNDHGAALTEDVSKQDKLVQPRRPLKQYLINNSVLYAMFRNVRGMLRAKDARLIHTEKGYDGSAWTLAPVQPDVAARAAEMATHLDGFEARLIELAGLIRGIGAMPIFVTQHQAGYRIRGDGIYGRPMPDGTVDTGDYAGLMAFNARNMAVCRRLRAICIDLAADLRFEDGDHYDRLHTTPKGSAKIGRYLYSRLKDVIP